MTFECMVSFTYDAETPADAAKQFIANIQNNPNWFVKVKEIETNKNYTVDTETDDTEEN